MNNSGDGMIRIYVLAKQLNVDSGVILDTIRQLGIAGKGTTMAGLTSEEVALVKNRLNDPKYQEELQKRKQEKELERKRLEEGQKGFTQKSFEEWQKQELERKQQRIEEEQKELERIRERTEIEQRDANSYWLSYWRKWERKRIERKQWNEREEKRIKETASDRKEEIAELIQERKEKERSRM